ncbi:hypothetical protein [Sorangium sp. So ce233]|uniref:hypothetical protein n=1 Tax=Sorangium sp. So ce233 TaxID=3133290 RepID=UPI003F60940D
MTGLEFIAAGVAFERDGDGLHVKGPAGRAELLYQLRFEVVTRIELVKGGRIRWVRKPHCCDVCGDQIGHDLNGRCVLCDMTSPATGKRLCRSTFGGMCELCVLARQKVLRDEPRR